MFNLEIRVKNGSFGSPICYEVPGIKAIFGSQDVPGCVAQKFLPTTKGT